MVRWKEKSFSDDNCSVGVFPTSSKGAILPESPVSLNRFSSKKKQNDTTFSSTLSGYYYFKY